MQLILQKYINRFGYEIEHGYFIISKFNYDLKAMKLTFTGDIYLSKDTYEAGFQPIDQFEDTVGFNEIPENPFEFPYDHIKSIVDNMTVEEVLQTSPRYKGFVGYTEDNEPN